MRAGGHSWLAAQLIWIIADKFVFGISWLGLNYRRSMCLLSIAFIIIYLSCLYLPLYNSKFGSNNFISTGLELDLFSFLDRIQSQSLVSDEFIWFMNNRNMYGSTFPNLKKYNSQFWLFRRISSLWNTIVYIFLTIPSFLRQILFYHKIRWLLEIL